jgi:hypothetical protein
MSSATAIVCCARGAGPSSGPITTRCAAIGALQHAWTCARRCRVMLVYPDQPCCRLAKSTPARNSISWRKASSFARSSADRPPGPPRNPRERPFQTFSEPTGWSRSAQPAWPAELDFAHAGRPVHRRPRQHLAKPGNPHRHPARTCSGRLDVACVRDPERRQRGTRRANWNGRVSGRSRCGLGHPHPDRALSIVKPSAIPRRADPPGPAFGFCNP